MKPNFNNPFVLNVSVPLAKLNNSTIVLNAEINKKKHDFNKIYNSIQNLQSCLENISEVVTKNTPIWHD